MTRSQITASTKRIIDINQDIIVEVDGVAQTSGYTVDTLNGTVLFTADQTGNVVTVTGYYVPTSTAAECHEWSNSITQDFEDTPRFQDEWNRKTPTLKSASGSLSEWYNVDTYFSDALIAGNPVVIELYAQDTLNPDRVWGVLNSVEMSAAVDGVAETSVSYESTNKMLISYTS